MANFEFGPCSLEEYKRHEEDRVMEYDLSPTNYSLMISLGKTAIIQPTIVSEVKKEDSGVYVVKFDMIDADFACFRQTECAFENGYWQPRKEDNMPAQYEIDRQVSQVEAAYFRNYTAPAGSGEQIADQDYIDEGLEKLIQHVHERDLVIVA